MKRSSNYHVEPVNTPEGLRIIEGWEIRKVHTGNNPGIILQNPDTGERRKLIIPAWGGFFLLGRHNTFISISNTF